MSEWVSAGLRSVVLVDQDASVQAEVKLFPSGLRFTDPFLLLVLELGEQAVGVPVEDCVSAGLHAVTDQR